MWWQHQRHSHWHFHQGNASLYLLGRRHPSPGQGHSSRLIKYGWKLYVPIPGNANLQLLHNGKKESICWVESFLGERKHQSCTFLWSSYYQKGKHDGGTHQAVLRMISTDITDFAQHFMCSNYMCSSRTWAVCPVQHKVARGRKLSIHRRIFLQHLLVCHSNCSPRGKKKYIFGILF